MSDAHDGRRIEYAVMADLREHGYITSRGRASKGGLGDVQAVGHGEMLFVNVKRTRPPGPADRRALIHAADCIPGVGVPLVALKPLRKPLDYRILTGPGPTDWLPWEPCGPWATCPVPGCNRSGEARTA